MWQDSLWSYLCHETNELLEWSKCGESALSMLPTVLWAAGTAALSHRMLSTLFRRFMFRRVAAWEVMLQNLLFVWMVIYSLHFWIVFVRILKILIDYCYSNNTTPEEIEGRKLLQQLVIWVCGMTPLAIYIHTQPRVDSPPLVIWITTSPWQRREMGAYGYYLNRPLSSLSTNNDSEQQAVTLRKAFSDSKIIIKEPPKKKRHSKSV